jgi:hypothetical protein
MHEREEVRVNFLVSAGTVWSCVLTILVYTRVSIIRTRLAQTNCGRRLQFGVLESCQSSDRGASSGNYGIRTRDEEKGSRAHLGRPCVSWVLCVTAALVAGGCHRRHHLSRYSRLLACIPVLRVGWVMMAVLAVIVVVFSLRTKQQRGLGHTSARAARTCKILSSVIG